MRGVGGATIGKVYCFTIVFPGKANEIPIVIVEPAAEVGVLNVNSRQF